MENDELQQIWFILKVRNERQRIIFDEEFKNNPENFYSWAFENGYKPGYFLRTKNENGLIFTKENMEFFEHKGTITDIGKINGTSYLNVHNKIKKYGKIWDFLIRKRGW